MTTRRLAIVLIALVAATAVGFGLIAHAASRSGERLRDFRDAALRFQYPASWQARRYQENGSFSSLIVDLSTQQMHPPCVTRHGSHNTTITCREPIDQLRPGSILVTWSSESWLGWSLAKAYGSRLRVGGRPAKLKVYSDSCGVGADVNMQVVVGIPGTAETDSWYQLDACIRKPGTTTKERQVRQLLRTVHFTG